MIYVFDTSVFIILFKHFYRERFPTLWSNFDALIENEQIVSTKEVLKEIIQPESLIGWAKNNKVVFAPPNQEELAFVAEIFNVHHFQTLVKIKERMIAKSVADPFVIAKAKIINGCVVTQESHPPNAAKIPNVCEHFNIPCMNLEDFMKKEKWKF